MEKESESNVFSTILGAIMGLYALSTQIFAIYFWWNMMKEDNFFMAIFLDPFIAEFKGIFWPFFI